MMPDKIKLSVCIATFNRGKFIGETLDSILPQLTDEVELVIVNGCSPDNTDEVMRSYLSKYSNIKYFRETLNSGIDGDYDKAVQYATGEYCWLMTDDDLIKPGAISQILQRIKTAWDLVVLNAEVATVDFAKILDERLIKKQGDKIYYATDNNKMMAEMGHGLSFIGCVVINKEKWISRNRSSFFGTFFVHAGVIFQEPFLEKVYFISCPLITIRYGNAMWTPRGLEIWLFKWPKLIWSFPDYSDEAKAAVCPTSSIKKIQRLFFYRATGAYHYAEYKRFFASRCNIIVRLAALGIVAIPPLFANIIASLFCLLKRKSSRMPIYSLDGSRFGNFISSAVARIIGV